MSLKITEWTYFEYVVFIFIWTNAFLLGGFNFKNDNNNENLTNYLYDYFEVIFGLFIVFEFIFRSVSRGI